MDDDSNSRRSNKLTKILRSGTLTALCAGALFAVPTLARADDWQANSPDQIAGQISDPQTVYTIRSGDTLWGISEALKAKGTTLTPQQIAQLNSITNIDLIYAGNTLKFTGGKITVQPAQPSQPQPSQPSTGQVDKTALSAKIQEANKYLYTNGVYTKASLENLQIAVQRGNGIIKSDAASQQDVNNAIVRISQAINGLQRISGQEVNKQPLEAKLQEANKYLYTNGVYTDASLEALQVAAQRGNGVIKSDAASQQDVNNAIARISQAINGLQKKSDQNVNKQPLEAKLQEANKYLQTNGVYTDDSLEALQVAAQRGNGVIKSDAASQQDVNNAITRIDTAINGLQKQ